jgi:hypothetical protein
MTAEDPYYLEYDPNFRVAVTNGAILALTQDTDICAKTRELRFLRLWPKGLMPLTAIISVQFVSVANAAIVGGPPRSVEFSGAIQLSSCKLSGVPQPARCGVLEVPENPADSTTAIQIAVAVLPRSQAHEHVCNCGWITGKPHLTRRWPFRRVTEWLPTIHPEQSTRNMNRWLLEAHWHEVDG